MSNPVQASPSQSRRVAVPSKLFSSVLCSLLFNCSDNNPTFRSPSDAYGRPRTGAVVLFTLLRDLCSLSVKRSASEPNRVVQSPALRAARSIDVWIIRVNEAAFGAAKNAVIAWRRAKALLTVSRIHREAANYRQRKRYISTEKRVGRHITGAL
jgi:hypothetical protein